MGRMKMPTAHSLLHIVVTQTKVEGTISSSLEPDFKGLLRDQVQASAHSVDG